MVTIFCLRSYKPLVTPGDAIESFITEPAAYSLGSSVLGKMTTHRISIALEPRKWHSTIPNRRLHAIPKRVWLASYTIFTLSIGVLVVFFAIAMNNSSLL